MLRIWKNYSEIAALFHFVKIVCGFCQLAEIFLSLPPGHFVMSQDKDMKSVRLGRELKREREKNLAQQRHHNMERAKWESSSTANSSSVETSREGSPIIITRNSIQINIDSVSNLTQIQQNTMGFAIDLLKNIFRKPNGRRWSNITLRIFSLVHSLYSNVLPFFSLLVIIPVVATIKNFYKNNIKVQTNYLFTLEETQRFAQTYKNRYNLTETSIVYGIIAVDAISVDPNVKVFENGTVKGLINATCLSKEEIEELRYEVYRQERYLAQIKNQTISAAFIYQFQPLCPFYDTAIIYIEPSNTSKADEKQVQNLFQIKNGLEQENFKIVAFASDGDSGYRSLVNSTLIQYKFGTRPILITNNTLYTNDPLHVLKRGRYRFLSHNFTLLNKNSTVFNYSKIINLLNLPGYVFSNSRYTKMQDSLPLKLFSLQNLNLLLQTELFSHAAYFLPFCLMNTALSSDALSIDERVDYLEISFHYMALYKELVSNAPKNKIAPQKGSKTVLLFDLNLINDYLVTILTINTVINTLAGPISLNMIGTNPLEHHFGLLRLKCKYKHDFETISRNEEQLQLYQHLKKDLLFEKIRSRKSYYAVTLFLTNRLNGSPNNFHIAKSLLNKFGIFKSRNLSHITIETNYALFLSKIQQNIVNDELTKKETVFTSHEIHMNPSVGAYIQKRQDFASFKNNHLDISKDDYSQTIPETSDALSSSEDEKQKPKRKRITTKRRTKIKSSSQI